MPSQRSMHGTPLSQQTPYSCSNILFATTTANGDGFRFARSPFSAMVASFVNGSACTATLPISGQANCVSATYPTTQRSCSTFTRLTSSASPMSIRLTSASGGKRRPFIGISGYSWSPFIPMIGLSSNRRWRGVTRGRTPIFGIGYCKMKARSAISMTGVCPA